MASTYSDLKIQLMATGENSGTWGDVTNTNLGTAIEEAITGSADVAFSSADVTLTLTNTNATQSARNLRLNLTGTSGGARNLIVPAIEKIYIINNGLADTVTVKNAAGTGIAVPAGKTMYVYNNSTNVVDAITHLTSLTLGSALPVASGGTGITSFGAGVATFLGTPSSANLKTAVTDETGSGALVFATSPTLVTPALGTPSSGTLTNATGLPIVAGTTGTLSVARGGTGATTSTGSGAVVLATSPTLVTPALGTPSSGTLTNATGLPIVAGTTGTLSVARGGTGATTSTGSGAVVLATSPTLVTPALGTPSSGTLTNATDLPIVAGTTGTLSVARGGTGQTTYTNGQLLIGNTTGGTLAKATLTAGTGVSITNGAGSISIAATNNGTVTSVGGTGSVDGITLTGTVTSSGNLTLGGTLAISATQITSGTLAVARGGTGITSFGAGVATFLGTPSSANLRTAVTDETGSGALVFATSPTLVTPALGTPSSGTLTNATGLPIVAGTTGTLSVARGGTGATTSTGSGAVVLATSPTLVTPALGTPSSGNLANCTFPTLNQNTTGNAATATALQTARTIGGVSFNGTANIDLPGVNTAGNQDTTGNATTATTATDATNVIGGSGQTWQSVIGSRSSGVTYTNSTGRPISLCIHTTTGGTGILTVGGISMNRASNNFWYTAIVPNGVGYSFNGGYTVWVELR
jgi:hypothetical protein